MQRVMGAQCKVVEAIRDGGTKSMIREEGEADGLIAAAGQKKALMVLGSQAGTRLVKLSAGTPHEAVRGKQSLQGGGTESQHTIPGT